MKGMMIMMNKEITYIIVGLIIMLVMHVIEAINHENSRVHYENVSELVGGLAAFSVKVMLWPIIVVNKILIKIN